MSDTPVAAKKNILGSIETGRGIAAFLVVLYHASVHMDKETGERPFSSAFLFGHAGVDFFFVISGFIIFYVHRWHLGEPSRLPDYFMRRIARIYPLFWVALVFSMLMLVLKGEALPSFDVLSLDALLVPADSLVGVSWTLRHEMLFYALFGVFFIIGFANGAALCVIWAVVMLYFLAIGAGKETPFVFASYNLQFIMGMMVAYLAHTFTFSRLYSFMMLGGGVVLFFAVGYLENTGIMDGYADPARLYYGIPSAMIVLGCAQLDRYHAVRPWRAGVFFGSLSYSIYLMHLFGMAIGNQVLGVLGLGASLSSEMKMLYLTAAGLGFGVVTGLLIERPLQKMFQTQRKKQAQRTAQVV